MNRLWSCALVAVLGCGSDPAPSPVDLVDATAYESDLTSIASAPRSVGTPHHKAVQDLCADRFAALGFDVERHAYATGVNVIGVRTGTKLPAERVVISAHYDSVLSCPGADDNGSGVAGTLEAARVLSQQPHDRTLVVACWDEEERGLIGSKAYAARAKAAGDAIVLSIVYEMIGYRSTAPMSQKTDPSLEAVFPDAAAQIQANEYRGDFTLVVNDEHATTAFADLQKVALDVGLPVVNLSLLDALKRNLDQLRRSDHAPFWDADYPAILMTDTAEFRNSHYHCLRSTQDALADIDFEFATLNVKVAVGTAAAALDR
jgi:Zn-dependent M28 family amino/carboxypeptidase